MPPTTLGIILGNRGFFPDHLLHDARRQLLDLFGQFGLRAVILGEDQGKKGGVETYAHAQQCADLFRAGDLDGVLVSLPNFGDERAVTDTLKLARLDVPVLVQASPDDPARMDVANRRDAFCGKLSVCNNLRQANIPFSLTTRHVVALTDPSFAADLERFAAVCRVVSGVRGARLGAVGARPDGFNTVRFSEKILEDHDISVSTVDLSEILGAAERLADDDPRVAAAAQALTSYADAQGVPRASLLLMAKLDVALNEWTASKELDAIAVQCWTSMQENYGIQPCAVMSMMSARLVPSACEVDVTGALAMYALQLASQSPSALMDWNNNYGADDDKCVLFHCGNWPASFLADAKIRPGAILGATLGEERTWGALEGAALPCDVTFARASTDDAVGILRAYVGEGTITDDPLTSFGSTAVLHVPGLQRLLRYLCAEGFEHHVAINRSTTAEVLEEALGHYLGWEVHRHAG